MKSQFLLLSLAACFFAACASEPTPPAKRGGKKSSSSSSSKPARSRLEDPSTKRPRIGMSTSQVRETYGRPDSVTSTSRGEVWAYVFNRGHAYIPYNYGYRARTGTFTFNGAGRLVDFTYNE